MVTSELSGTCPCLPSQRRCEKALQQGHLSAQMGNPGSYFKNTDSSLLERKRGESTITQEYEF